MFRDTIYVATAAPQSINKRRFKVEMLVLISITKLLNFFAKIQLFSD